MLNPRMIIFVAIGITVDHCYSKLQTENMFCFFETVNPIIWKSTNYSHFYFSHFKQNFKNLQLLLQKYHRVEFRALKKAINLINLK